MVVTRLELSLMAWPCCCMQAQTEARRAADRRVKDAEVKLSGVVSARHRLERESKDRNQVH